jgi:hypothetical protein
VCPVSQPTTRRAAGAVALGKDAVDDVPGPGVGVRLADANTEQQGSDREPGEEVPDAGHALLGVQLAHYGP